jgi:hypothetical protein
MRGFERVGTITPDGFVTLDDVNRINGSDILCFSPSADGPMRSGYIRARDGLSRCLALCFDIVAIAPGDHVFRALPLGESAFSRIDPAPPLAQQ